MKRSKLALIVLGLVFFLAACGGSDEADDGEETFEVGFAIKTQDSPYFVALANAVEEYGEERGWDVTVLDAGNDTTVEQDNINTFVSQGKDLIFVDAIDPSSVVPAINAAADAGVPVINLDSGVDEDANDVTTVYSDNEQNGRLVGLEYGAEMGDEEIIAILLSGMKGNVAGLERRTGLFAGIIEARTALSEEEAWEAAHEFESDLASSGRATNEDADFSVVGQGWGSWTEEEGLSAAEDLITANPDLTTALGENEQMLFGAMTALDNAGNSDVDLVSAADGAQEAMDLIRDGEYFATGLNSPILVAETGYEVAEQILVEGADPESIPDITLTEPAAITSENVDEYFDLGF